MGALAHGKMIHGYRFPGARGVGIEGDPDEGFVVLGLVLEAYRAIIDHPANGVTQTVKPIASLQSEYGGCYAGVAEPDVKFGRQTRLQCFWYHETECGRRLLDDLSI